MKILVYATLILFICYLYSAYFMLANYEYKYNKYKKKYLELKAQNGGSIYKLPKTNKEYIGAGLMIVDKYNNRPCVILFESTKKMGKNKYYEDLGGQIDKEDLKLYNYDPLVQTAIREAFEESRGLLNFTSVYHVKPKIFNKNMFVDVENKHGYLYRSYFVCIDNDTLDNVSYKDYHKNIKNLDKPDIPNVMKETTNYKRFYVKDLVDDGIMKAEHHFKTTDVDGNEAFIMHRTVNIIKKGILAKLFGFIINHPIKFTKVTSLISYE